MLELKLEEFGKRSTSDIFSMSNIVVLEMEMGEFREDDIFEVEISEGVVG